MKFIRDFIIILVSFSVAALVVVLPLFLLCSCTFIDTIEFSLEGFWEMYKGLWIVSLLLTFPTFYVRSKRQIADIKKEQFLKETGVLSEYDKNNKE